MKDELKLPNDERLFWFLTDIASSEGVEADAAAILCRYLGYISITRSGHTAQAAPSYSDGIEAAAIPGQYGDYTPVTLSGLTTPVNEPHAWLIRKGGYYYRPNRAGYTTSKAEAGRYTEAEARKEADIEPWHMSAVHADDSPAFVFTYRNHRGVYGVRRVQPIGVRYGTTEWHPEPQWLLRAFDLDKDAEREFAMSEIAPASAVAEWRPLEDCPSDESDIWLASFWDGVWRVESREAIGDWWRTMDTPRMWMPRQREPAPPKGDAP